MLKIWKLYGLLYPELDLWFHSLRREGSRCALISKHLRALFLIKAHRRVLNSLLKFGGDSISKSNQFQFQNDKQIDLQTHFSKTRVDRFSGMHNWRLRWGGRFFILK